MFLAILPLFIVVLMILVTLVWVIMTEDFSLISKFKHIKKLKIFIVYVLLATIINYNYFYKINLIYEYLYPRMMAIKIIGVELGEEHGGIKRTYEELSARREEAYSINPIKLIDMIMYCIDYNK